MYAVPLWLGWRRRHRAVGARRARLLCRPEIAEQVGEIMVRYAREPGEFYGFKVPLDAEYKIGRSWAGEPLGDAQENDRHTTAEPEIAAGEIETPELGAPDRTSHAGDDGAAGNAGLIWLAPTSIEVP